MKILSIPQVRLADAYTISKEPISSIDLMERAGKACSEWLLTRVRQGQKVRIYCGQGNNGGDGLVIGRHLHAAGFDVKILVIGIGKTSTDFTANLERISSNGGIPVSRIDEASDLPDGPADDVLIDCMFGSGLSRPPVGLAADVIDHINKAEGIVVAIDIPSGLFGDSSTKGRGVAVRADYTLSLQFPKLAYLFPENEEYVGEWEVIPIGLHPDFIAEVDVDNYYLQHEDLVPVLKPRSRFSHKGDFGHALLIAGSKHKMGAAILAAKAALRSGAGLLTVHIPESGISSMHTALPEAMVSSWEGERFIDGLPDLNRFNAIAIGPGLGTDDATAASLKLLIQEYRRPLILDADALNILAMNPTWLAFLARNSILTPHPGEFVRLTGKNANEFDRHKALVSFAEKHGLITLLKGGNTAIGCTDGYCFFNSTGNPGMATAGSGDVLTGIILGILAQNYEPEEAAILGAYIHGLAGDMAASELGVEALIAGDITASLHKAFRSLYRKEPQVR